MGKIQKAIAAIVAERNELGQLKQKDLAKALGCSQATVSHILTGARGLSEKWIEALCEALDITLGDIEQPTPRPPEPKQLREYSEKLKRLYEISHVPAFRSISRAMDDWLEATETVATKQAPAVRNDVVGGDFQGLRRSMNHRSSTTATRAMSMTRRGRRSTRNCRFTTSSACPPESRIP